MYNVQQIPFLVNSMITLAVIPTKSTGSSQFSVMSFLIVLVIFWVPFY